LRGVDLHDVCRVLRGLGRGGVHVALVRGGRAADRPHDEHDLWIYRRSCTDSGDGKTEEDDAGAGNEEEFAHERMGSPRHDATLNGGRRQASRCRVLRSIAGWSPDAMTPSAKRGTEPGGGVRSGGAPAAGG